MQTSQWETSWPRPPVDGLTGDAVALIGRVTGAVDEQPRLVTVGVLVTAAVILGAQVRSCIQRARVRARIRPAKQLFAH